MNTSRETVDKSAYIIPDSAQLREQHKLLCACAIAVEESNRRNGTEIPVSFVFVGPRFEKRYVSVGGV